MLPCLYLTVNSERVRLFSHPGDITQSKHCSISGHNVILSIIDVKRKVHQISVKFLITHTDFPDTPELFLVVIQVFLQGVDNSFKTRPKADHLLLSRVVPGKRSLVRYILERIKTEMSPRTGYRFDSVCNSPTIHAMIQLQAERRKYHDRLHETT